MTYKLIRSSRKTVSLQVGPEGLTVRAPCRVSKKEIDSLVEKRSGWIEKHLKKAEADRKAAADAGFLTADDVKELGKRALSVIPGRVARYAPIVGVTPGRVTIRNQRTKWGSCSSGGNLNFNCLLMLTPDIVIDGIVVHELCHLKEMNHSERFYAEVLRAFPEYPECEKWLKENGAALLARVK
ncbi:MAG: M48 family metallopeptidase [Clostridia bacterium]|nr:M48 family metallopeptidase [Clostridia bacterium]MBO4792593.1 M48 family metallopeptidase [Clostridia bacterium]